MADLDVDALRAAVEAQARARVEGDTALFASYMTAQALLQLGGVALPPGRLKNHQVLDISADGDSATRSADVRYAGAWTYVLRTRWQFVDGAWKATEATLLADTVRAPWWRRLIGRDALSRRPPAQRRDLS